MVALLMLKLDEEQKIKNEKSSLKSTQNEKTNFSENAKSIKANKIRSPQLK
jgi:hypothetical protein